MGGRRGVEETLPLPLPLTLPLPLRLPLPLTLPLPLLLTLAFPITSKGATEERDDVLRAVLQRKLEVDKALAARRCL